MCRRRVSYKVIENEFIRYFTYERKTLQKSKYARREKVFIFKCINIDCNNEIQMKIHDAHKVSGRCRPCSDKKSAKLRGLNYRKNPYEALYNNFKKRSKKYNKQNDITYTQFLIFTNEKSCHYCFDNLYWTEYNVTKNGSSYNLDRKDNKKGYSLDNCVACCWKCNESKKDNYSYKEWYGMTEYFRRKHEK